MLVWSVFFYMFVVCFVIFSLEIDVRAQFAVLLAYNMAMAGKK